MPNMLEIIEIASNTPFRTVTLSGVSVTVLFSALDGANRLHDWWATDGLPTIEEWDIITSWLAGARKELMMSLRGQIFATAGDIAPIGCLLCDGTTYEKIDYPDLYAALAPAFIVDADSFTVPDLRERFVYGAPSGADIGLQGGEALHTLSVDELPAHSHSIPTTTTSLALEPGEVPVLSPVPIIPSATGDTGAGSPHQNLPPYLYLAYYIVAV